LGHWAKAGSDDGAGQEGTTQLQVLAVVLGVQVGTTDTVACAIPEATHVIGAGCEDAGHAQGGVPEQKGVQAQVAESPAVATEEEEAGAHI